MTDDEIHGFLVEWLKATLNVAVIRAYQSGGEPAAEYVVVNFTGAEEVREFPSDVEFEDDQVQAFSIPLIEKDWTFSVHAYGEAPTDILRPLVSVVQVTQEKLSPFVIHDLSRIRNVPDFVNQEWRPRAQMDIVLRGLARDKVAIDVIEIVEFNLIRKGIE